MADEHAIFLTTHGACMMSTRPSRTHRAPLAPDLAVVPVSLVFQQAASSSANTSMDSAAEAPERPFPQFTRVRRGGGRIRPPASTQAGTEVAEVANNGIAAPAELGERAELPLLASSTKDDFDKALAELKRLSEAVFVPTPTTPPPTPPPVSEVIIIDEMLPPPPPPV
ncbi:hypothetical protein R3P38DRAFT_2782442 [Favolaschia claudopus]|uniref:Uncharacterized protein n=1 Tax=Favolaschia claudopus TaxID=2862362 RepID=A0AAW0B420_9AGAR